MPASFRRSAGGLRPERLEIEITESVFLADVGQSLPAPEVAGRSWASASPSTISAPAVLLPQLSAHLRLRQIKLDRSFIAGGIDTDPGNLAIVRAVVGIGSGFNATTLAEGIETEAQLLLICARAFHGSQGYLLGKPMPLAETNRLIAGRSVVASTAA